MPDSKKEWLTKDEAAERLKMSVRSVQVYVSEGRILRKQERDPATHQLVTMLHAGEVEALAYERDHPEAAEPVQARETKALQAPKQTAELLEFARLFTTVQTARQAPVNRWMGLDQAEAEYGLSRRLLVHLIRIGELPAFQDQPIKTEASKRAKAGSSWRVCRRDLEALTGHRHGEVAQAAR